jgi:hypothetical protein
MPKYFCNLSSLWFDGLTALDLSIGFVLAVPLICGLPVLFEATSTLGRPLTFGVTFPAAFDSCRLVLFRKENLFFSCFEDFGDSWLIGLGDLAVISAGLVAPPTVCVLAEAQVADVSGRSKPDGDDEDRAVISGAKVISKPGCLVSDAILTTRASTYVAADPPS